MNIQSARSVEATVLADLSGSTDRRTTLVNASVATSTYLGFPSSPVAGPQRSMWTRSFGRTGWSRGSNGLAGKVPLDDALRHTRHLPTWAWISTSIPGHQKISLMRSAVLKKPP